MVFHDPIKAENISPSLPAGRRSQRGQMFFSGPESELFLLNNKLINNNIYLVRDAPAGLSVAEVFEKRRVLSVR